MRSSAYTWMMCRTPVLVLIIFSSTVNGMVATVQSPPRCSLGIRVLSVRVVSINSFERILKLIDNNTYGTGVRGSLL